MINELDINNDEQFYDKLDAAVKEHNLTAKDLSAGLGVARTTVERWFQRIVIPHPLMRPSVFRFINKLISERTNE